MSWLSDLWGRVFTKDRTEYFAKLVVKAVKLFLGKAAKSIWNVIIAEVRVAEESGKTGTQKMKMVFEAIRLRLGEGDIPTVLLRLLIESAVVVVKAERGKLG